MKRYDERIESIFKKYDERLAEQKRHRSMLIRRTAAVTLGTAAVLVIGIATQVMKPPRNPEPQSSGIITETSTATTDTTVTTTALLQTSKASTPQATTTATVTTTTAESMTTAMHSTTAKLTTTARSTVSSVRQTTVTFTTQTTAGTEAKMTNSPETNTTGIGETAPIEYWRRVYYGDDNTIYRTCSKDNEHITAAISDVGAYFGDAILAIDWIDPLTNQKTRIDKSCQLFAYKSLSPEYVCAVKENGSSEFTLYRTDANFETLGELIQGTDIENMLVLKEAYYGFIEPDEAPVGYPDIDSLMSSLSDHELESYKSSILNGSASYTIFAEIPEFGDVGTITLLKDRKSGYISFDILGNKSTFDIGIEKLDEFISSFTE